VSHPFVYHRASSLRDATEELSQPGALPLGGGTDLLTCIDEGLTEPDVLVDLRDIPGADLIDVQADGSVRIGFAARIDTMATHATILAEFPVLAQACDAVGTPALRAMGTLGGNLCQRPRCWYYRGNIACLKNGGDSCPARDGENQYLAILDAGPCYAVHPSDPAVALTALDARVEITGASGARLIPIAELYALPRQRADVETVLAYGEFISAVMLPPEAAGGQQFYEKLMQRATWDFALVSIAAARRRDGDVRLVFGGVAPRPWRVNISIEEDVSAGGLDPETIDTLVERAFYDAAPLSNNGYKVQVAGALLRRAITTLV
jgi:xanthine dehydrogenase YagS FAD-binding subunit